MTPDSKLLQQVRKEDFGVEIGPSHNPVAPKRDGYQVHIIDHLNREQLVAKYRDHEVDLTAIEEVDFVWSGQSYAELTGKTHFYDWIIASHLIEHTPDMIGFLQNCNGILKDDGVLSLAIPDKRYCFDRFRPITGLARVVDSHFGRPTVHSAGSAAEYFLNVVSKNKSIAWDASTAGRYEFVHTAKHAIDGMTAVINDNAYLDVHAWCFVPHSFRLLIEDLNVLGLIKLREVAFHPTQRHEFFVTLGRHGSGPGLDRMQLLEIIDTEIGRGVIEGSPAETR